MKETVQLLDGADVNRTVARIAHQIIEKTALDEDDSRRVVLWVSPPEENISPIDSPTKSTNLWNHARRGFSRHHPLP